MGEVRQLELELWTVLREASAAPEDATFSPIWRALEQVLPGMAVVEQLKMASETIAQVTEIFEVQAGLVFEELDASATQDGPRMGADAFDRYVRQSMAIDFELYLEEPEALPRQARMVSEKEFYNEGDEEEKAELMAVLHEEMVLSEAEAHAEAMSVAHGEDISEWIAAIGEELSRVEGAIELLTLLELVRLPLVELWLGLLLGGYGLRREDVGEEGFYSAMGIWVAIEEGF